VRIPAAACGLVGIKPGRGVVPVNLGANDWYGMVEHGILATTVADATVGLAVLAGWEPPQLVEPERLRVAVSTRSPVNGVRPDVPARAAVAAAAKLLVAADHDASERGPRYPVRLGVQTIATWLAAAYNDVRADHLDVKSLQPRSQRHVALGRWATRRRLVAQEHRDRYRAECEAWFDRFEVDVLLTPALATSPPPALRYSGRSWFSNMVASTRFAPYAAPWNVAGFPALVVPMGVRPDGLPVGVQLVGPPGTELRLLAVAGQLEAASPWLRHAPGWPYPAEGAVEAAGSAGEPAP
jgi:amidase